MQQNDDSSPTPTVSTGVGRQEQQQKDGAAAGAAADAVLAVGGETVEGKVSLSRARPGLALCDQG